MPNVIHSYLFCMSHATPSPLLTTEQARAQLDARGESISEFARRNGLKPQAVFKVLYGYQKGRRGAAHRAAVALGLKRGEV